MRPLNEHGSTSKKRKRPSRAGGDDDADEDGEEGHGHSAKFPGDGKKGISSGLSTIVTRGGRSGSGGGEKTKWWKELGGGLAKSKGSIKI
jgi:RNA exonuclease 4